mmetsp:Transcript_17352/g.44418  ORF Transcript_17352/g.44418 Transcript_17352/m.44418 type:complete len:350 (+) Transcript_17352:351-1400(+)
MRALASPSSLRLPSPSLTVASFSSSRFISARCFSTAASERSSEPIATWIKAVVVPRRALAASSVNCVARSTGPPASTEPALEPPGLDLPEKKYDLLRVTGFSSSTLKANILVSATGAARSRPCNSTSSVMVGKKTSRSGVTWSQSEGPRNQLATMLVVLPSGVVESERTCSGTCSGSTSSPRVFCTRPIHALTTCLIGYFCWPPCTQTSRMRLGRKCVHVKMPVETPSALEPPSKRERSSASPPSAEPSSRSTARLKSKTCGGSSPPSYGLAPAADAALLGAEVTRPSSMSSGSAITSKVSASRERKPSSAGVTSPNARLSRCSKRGFAFLPTEVGVVRSSIPSAEYLT